MEALTKILQKAEEKLRATTNEVLEWTEKEEITKNIIPDELKVVEQMILEVYRSAKIELKQAVEELKATR